MRALLSKLAICAAGALGLVTIQATPALACGSLIAPDGDVRLARAATLIAWHDGIEHYLTSFAYQGNESNIGWIVPLPAVPLKIEAGGAWTLQRLQRETQPQPRSLSFGAADVATSAQVLQRVQVEALNVTVVKGSGPAIIEWAKSNGFFLDDETAAHLAVYAKGSSIFMAAKYDTTIAQQRHQLEGDGVPLLITMKTAHPWVPLEVLALEGQQVNADLYFLTDQPLTLSDFDAFIGQPAVGREVPGAPGLRVVFQERMTDQLYHDLSTDRNMGWVWRESWFTALSLNAPEPQVTYDLGISPRGVIRLAPYGTPPMAVVDGVQESLPSWLPSLPIGTPQALLGLLALLLVGAFIFWLVRGAGRAHPAGAPAWATSSSPAHRLSGTHKSEPHDQHEEPTRLKMQG